MEVTPGGITIDGSLSYILQWAYDLKKYQVSGPGWIGAERLRIVAKSAATTNNRKLGSGGTSVRTSMAQLADLLDGCCFDPVMDRTGLSSRYDFALDISSYMPIQQSGDLPVILNEAMQRQFGIGLEHRKVTIEVLVVDHAEKVPLDN